MCIPFENSEKFNPKLIDILGEQYKDFIFYYGFTYGRFNIVREHEFITHLRLCNSDGFDLLKEDAGNNKIYIIMSDMVLDTDDSIIHHDKIWSVYGYHILDKKNPAEVRDYIKFCNSKMYKEDTRYYTKIDALDKFENLKE